MALQKEKQMDKTAENNFKNFLKEQDLDATFWEQIFSEKKINRESQLKYLSVSDWTEIESKVRAEWGKEALNSLQTKMCANTAEELTIKMKSCGLEVLYWSQTLKLVNGTSCSQFLHLKEVDWQFLNSKCRNQMEKKCLEDLRFTTLNVQNNSSNELSKRLESYGLNSKYWLRTFNKLNVTDFSQLRHLEDDDWETLNSKCSNQVEKKCLKDLRLTTKNVQNDSSNEFSKKLLLHGLNPKYWSPVFKEIDIEDVNQLQFLDEKTWKSITSKRKHQWEQNALDKLKNSTEKPSPEGVAVAKLKEELKNSGFSKTHATAVSNATDSFSKTSENFADKLKFDENETFDYYRNQVKDVLLSSQEIARPFKGFSEDSLLEMIKKASDGCILRGVFIIENKILQIKSMCNVIEVCGEINAFNPKHPEEDDIREFLSKETFTYFNNCLNTGAIGIMHPLGSVGFDENNIKASGTGMKTSFYSTMKYKKVSIQSFKLDETNISLTESVIERLQDIENCLRIFGASSKTAITLTRIFFREVGTLILA